MSTDTSGRRQKVVMALGIATIVLFSANLLTVLAKHFWPDNGLPFLSKQEVVVAEAPHAAYEVAIVEGIRNHQRKHHVIVHVPDVQAVVELDALDRQLAEMEQATRLLEVRLNREYSRAHMDEIRLLTERAVQQAKEAAETAAEAVDVRVIEAGDGVIEWDVERDDDRGTRIRIRASDS